MFAFREYSKLGGRISKIDAPLSTTLGPMFGQGWDDSVGVAAWRFGEDIAERNSPMISPKLANKLYGIDGALNFTEDVRAGRALLMRQRKQKELERMAFLDSIESSPGKAVAGFGAAVLGNIINPVDLGFAFVPVVGSAKAAAKLSKAGASAWRVRMAKGLISSEEALALRGVPFPRITSSVIDGTVGAAITEVPVFLQKTRDQAFYGPADAAFNIAAGGLFSGGFRAALEGLGRALSRGRDTLNALTPEHRALADVKAMDDYANGKRVDISDVVQLDENMIRQRVVFDKTTAKRNAIMEVDAESDSIRAEVVAQMEIQGNLGRVNDKNLVKVMRDIVEFSKDFETKVPPHEVSIIKRLLQRFDEGDRSMSLFENAANLLDMVYDPQSKQFPMAYYLGKPTDTILAVSGRPGRKRMDEKLANLYMRQSELQIRIEQLEGDKVGDNIKDQPVISKQHVLQKQLEEIQKQIPHHGMPLSRAERQAHMMEKEARLQNEIRAERIKRVNELVERKRKEAQNLARTELIAEQQATGRLLSEDEIDRMKFKEQPEPSDMAAIKEDIQTLKKDLKIDDETFGQMEFESLKKFSYEPDSIQAAVDCIIENMKGFQ